MAQTQRDLWLIGSSKIPVKIVYENRTNTRFALASKAFIVRIPSFVSASEKMELRENARAWIASVLDKNPAIAKKFQQRVYRDGEVISCYDADFRVIFKPRHLSSMVRLCPKSETLSLPVGDANNNPVSSESLSKTIRVVFKDFYTLRIRYEAILLADRMGLPNYNDLKLRYMSTRWGSCAGSKGNITINSRLLLAPKQVLNSVILHELCHLVHPNHSNDFWSLVKRVDPDHRKHTAWLKTNGPGLQL